MEAELDHLTEAADQEDTAAVRAACVAAHPSVGSRHRPPGRRSPVAVLLGEASCPGLSNWRNRQLEVTLPALDWRGGVVGIVCLVEGGGGGTPDHSLTFAIWTFVLELRPR